MTKKIGFISLGCDKNRVDLEKMMYRLKSAGFELVDGKRENDFDELLPQALKLVIENGQASITILQRKLLIGYPRASRIVDQMETAGYISPSDGSKPRSVYMTMEEWEQKFKKD